MRVINIDEDTAVGYNYEAQHYFITNKSTTTTRTTTQDTLNVLDIVAPDHTVTENDLISLATTMESLYELSYTWDDTGSYIRTIQLNDYFKYPLTLDVDTKKLYIMNSTTIYDLTLNEAQRDRLQHIQAFYRDTLGLLVSLPDLRTLYNLLISYYNPTCYNEIHVEAEEATGSYTMFYNNLVKLSNYRSTAPLTYTCTLNPTDQYSYNTIASISNIVDNQITLTAEVPQQVSIGSKINIANTTTDMDIASYTADGTYTVKDIQDNLIYTTENLPATFSVVLPTLNIVAYTNYITSIDRDEQTITLTNFATDYVIGDKIVVRGATTQTPYETLSLDGFYTIIGIEDNVIYVDEVPLTNYTAPVGATPTAYIYKPIEVATVTVIDNNTITIAENIPTELTVNTTIVIFTTVEGEQGTTYMQYGTVTALTDKQVVVNTTLEDNVPKFGLLREPIPYPYTLININNSNSSILPNGNFMLDTQEQAISYLSLINNIPVPSNEALEDNKNNIGNFNSCNTQVRDYYVLHMPDAPIEQMACKGVYSRVYSQEE